MSDLDLPRFATAVRTGSVGVFYPSSMPTPPRRWRWDRYLRDTTLEALDDPATARFIFDSGTEWNTSDEAVALIRRTALELMRQGRFRLPASRCWIEDPFEVLNVRNYMLAEQQDHEVTIWPFFQSPKTHSLYYIGGTIHLMTNEPSDSFGFCWSATPLETPRPDPARLELLRNTDFAIRRFVLRHVAGGFRAVGDHFEVG